MKTNMNHLRLTAIAAVLLAPGAALAQVDADCTGSNPGVVNCAGPTFANGITHTTNGGNLTVNSANGVTSYGTGGFFTTGVGSNNVTMTKGTGNLLTTAAGTSAPIVIGASSESGDISVTTTGTVAGRAATAQYGISAVSTGGGDIAIDSAGGPVNVSTSTANPGIAAVRALTNGGNITLNAGVLAGPAAALLQTSGGGTVDATVGDITGNLRATTDSGTIRVANRVGGAVGSVTGGIQAISASGNIEVEFTGGITNFGTRTAGVLAQTGNGADIAIRNSSINTSNQDVNGARFNAALTTITNGDGATTIDWFGRAAGITSLNATIGSGGLVINYGADVLAGGGISTSSYVSGYLQNLTVMGDGDVTITLLDYSDQINVQGGATLSLNSHRLLRGTNDFSGIGGRVSLNLQANTYWRVDPGQINRMSAGDDVIQIDEGGGFFTNAVSLLGSQFLPPTQTAPAVVDFGEGVDVFTNRGTFYLSPNWSPTSIDTATAGVIPVGNGEFVTDYSVVRPEYRFGNQVEMRFENLEAFNNAGTIWMGATFIGTGSGYLTGKGGSLEDFISGRYRDDFLDGTDRAADDILSLPGTAFVGMEGSRIIMDANFNLIGQNQCGAAARGTGGQMANDCISLQGAGAGASGQTLVQVYDIYPGERGAYNPQGNVVVDLTGADPADIDPTAFVLAPESSGYNPNIGSGAVDKGLFFYTLGYDADNQQFRLYGLPGPVSQQFPVMATAANGLWNTATGGWFEQRAEDRAQNLPAGIGGGVWFRTSDDNAERDLSTTVAGGGQTINFDNSYEQHNTTLTLGLDLIDRLEGNARWNFGVMAGYARGRVEFDGGGNQALLAGMHAGLYSSYTHGGFYLDAAYNQNWLDLDSNAPGLQLQPEGTELASEVKSHGLRLETGWRFVLGRFGVEPLLGYAQVTSEINDILVPTGDPLLPGGTARYEDASSQRASAGLRLSVNDLMASVVPTSLSLTARAINETDGQARVSIANTGLVDAPAADSFDGSFTQLTGSVRVGNAAKTVSGYLNVDSTFNSDYETMGFSAGFRYQW